MNDDAFVKLVAEEVKNRASREGRIFLLKKENWENWSKALTALIQNLNQQLEDIQFDIESDTKRYSKIPDGSMLLSSALASYETRKKKIQRFRFHVQNRLNQVEKMISTGVEVEDEPLSALLSLQKAIRRHRELMYEYDLEETAIDKALWASLDGKWLFDSISKEDISL
jgi:septal ring factor EnvC (AmiA/AmiB activator)